MSTRRLGSAPRASKFQRILRRMSTKQYHYVGPVVQHPPVWVGKKRATFAGAKPANDVLKHHAVSFPARFAKLMRSAI